jgi:hypothetical protein
MLQSQKYSFWLKQEQMKQERKEKQKQYKSVLWTVNVTELSMSSP